VGRCEVGTEGETGMRKWEKGSGKWEVGMRKAERKKVRRCEGEKVGRRVKREGGSGKREVGITGRWKSEFGRWKNGFRIADQIGKGHGAKMMASWN